MPRQPGIQHRFEFFGNNEFFIQQVVLCYGIPVLVIFVRSTPVPFHLIVAWLEHQRIPKTRNTGHGISDAGQVVLHLDAPFAIHGIGNRDATIHARQCVGRPDPDRAIRNRLLTTWCLLHITRCYTNDEMFWLSRSI